MQKVRANFGIFFGFFSDFFSIFFGFFFDFFRIFFGIFGFFVIFSIFYLYQVNKCFRSMFLVYLMLFAILQGLPRWCTQIPSLCRGGKYCKNIAKSPTKIHKVIPLEQGWGREILSSKCVSFHKVVAKQNYWVWSYFLEIPQFCVHYKVPLPYMICLIKKREDGSFISF